MSTPLRPRTGLGYLHDSRWVRAFRALGPRYVVTSSSTRAECIRDRREVLAITAGRVVAVLPVARPRVGQRPAPSLACRAGAWLPAWLVRFRGVRARLRALIGRNPALRAWWRLCSADRVVPAERTAACRAVAGPLG